MSSTPNSSSNFQSILDAALSDYAKQTGIDLVTHPSAQTLQNCNSADAILDLLGDKANQFQAYRDGNRKLINCLKPVVQVLHAVSAILAEAAAMVSLRDQLVFSDPILTVHFPGAFPTHEGHPCRR
jgi:fungal STAND N-terminal Goodbye domain